MFLIAGVTPKTKTLDDAPRLCPVCGLAQAYLERVDHYFSLFFVPVIRVKTGDPVLRCHRCERQVDQRSQSYGVRPSTGEPMKTCQACGRPLETEFRYCPHCGKAI